MILQISLTRLAEHNVASGSDLKAFLWIVGVAVLTVVPFTMLRNAYSFSVGYGASVLTMALMMALAFDVPFVKPFRLAEPPEVWLTQVMILYGLRLTLFLLFREISVPRMGEQTKSFDLKPTLRILPLAASCGVLYAMMVSPMLYALRNPTTALLGKLVVWLGGAIAFVGLILEAIADQHKLATKRLHKIAYGEKRFVGPTTGTFNLCRHPNYLGEVMVWTGLWIGGIPSYGNKVSAWIASTLGWVCLLMIMKQSAARLDKKQQEWYGGQPDFEKWKNTVKGSLIPSPK